MYSLCFQKALVLKGKSAFARESCAHETAMAAVCWCILNQTGQPALVCVWSQGELQHATHKQITVPLGKQITVTSFGENTIPRTSIFSSSCFDLSGYTDTRSHIVQTGLKLTICGQV